MGAYDYQWKILPRAGKPSSNVTTSDMKHETVVFKTDADIPKDLANIMYDEEAEQYLTDYTEWIRFQRDDLHNRAEARKIAEGNIGYYAGYGSANERYRIEKLFNVEHPIFGSIDMMGFPTDKESLQCGIQGITLKELRSKNENSLDK